MTTRVEGNPRRRSSSRAWVVAAALGLAGTLPSAGPNAARAGGGKTLPPYALTDLGGLTVKPQPVRSYAYGLNEPGADGVVRIAGASDGPTAVPYSSSPELREQPALWSVDAKTGAVLSLARIGAGVFHDGRANSVNNAGIVVGVATVWDGYYRYPAFAAVPGVGLQPVTYPGNMVARANGINNDNDIVGVAGPTSGATSGAGWHVEDDGTISGPTDLGSFMPHAMNDSGVMAGEQDGAAAVAWFEGGVLQVRAVPGLFAGGEGMALAINNLDQVVGYSVEYVSGTSTWRPHPFLWTFEGGTVALGSLDGRGAQALDINDRGQVVGWSYSKTGNSAFLWESGRMTDLNGLVDTGGKATLLQATGINNAGHIVGSLYVQRPVSEHHGYLLRPNR